MLLNVLKNKRNNFTSNHRFIICLGISCIVPTLTCIILLIFIINNSVQSKIDYFRLDIGYLIIKRDAKYIPAVMKQMTQSIEHSRLSDVRIHVVSKETDIFLCDEIIKYTIYDVKCSSVPDYDNPNQERHNMDMIGFKRNVIINDAKQQQRDGVLFVDSDIVLNIDTIHRLVKACTDRKQHFDVCAAAYHLRWSTEPVVAVGTLSDHELRSVYHLGGNSGTCHRILGSGAGCTLVAKSAFEIPFEHKIDAMTQIYGEDVGFMINAHAADKSICALPRYHVTHLGAFSLMKMVQNYSTVTAN